MPGKEQVCEARGCRGREQQQQLGWQHLCCKAVTSKASSRNVFFSSARSGHGRRAARNRTENDHVANDTRRKPSFLVLIHRLFFATVRAAHIVASVWVYFLDRKKDGERNTEALLYIK